MIPQDSAAAWRMLPAALGLRPTGALRAAFAPLALTLALFLGPLALRVADWLEEQQRRRLRQSEVQIAPSRLLCADRLHSVQMMALLLSTLAL